MGNSINSLRGQGFTTMATDKPTKAKLQAAAAREGMTLAEYIRELADQVTKNKQGVLASSMAVRPEDKVASALSMVSHDTKKALSLTEAVAYMMLLFVDPWHAAPLINKYGGKVDPNIDREYLQTQLAKIKRMLNDEDLVAYEA